MFRPLARVSALPTGRLASLASGASPAAVATARFSMLSRAGQARVLALNHSRLQLAARQSQLNANSRLPLPTAPRRFFFQQVHKHLTYASNTYKTSEDEARGYNDPQKVSYALRAVYLLLGANAFVFALQTLERFFTGGKTEFMDRHFNLTDENLAEGRVWNLVTGFFRQTDMRALLNLLILSDPARLVALEYGPAVLLLLYTAGASAGHLMRSVDHKFIRPRVDELRTPEKREELPYNYEAPVSMAAGGAGAILAASLKKFGKTKIWPGHVLYLTKGLMFVGVVVLADLYDSMFRPVGGDLLSHSGYLAGGLVGMVSWASLPMITAPAWAATAGTVTTALSGAPFLLQKQEEAALPSLDQDEQ